MGVKVLTLQKETGHIQDQTVPRGRLSPLVQSSSVGKAWAQWPTDLTSTSFLLKPQYPCPAVSPPVPMAEGDLLL